MALEQSLRQELRREIDREVDTIRKQATEQGEQLVAEAERWAQRRSEEAAQRLDDECRLRQRRALARTEVEERNALLRLRRQEVDRAFQAAKERLEQMRQEEPDAYATLLAGVLQMCRQLLPEGPLQVRLGPGLEALGEELLKEDNVRLKWDAQLFGLQVEAEGGRLHCDGRLPSLLGMLRREREAELEAILFGEQT